MGGGPTYGYYADVYGGGLTEAAFAASLPTALAHVRWLCAARGADEGSDAFRRAVCAALEAFAEYGAGELGGYSVGQFSVRSYASQRATGEDLATAAALRELGCSGMAFSGVGR